MYECGNRFLRCRSVVSGFGSVVAETTAFAGLCDKLAGFNGNPLIVAMIA